MALILNIETATTVCSVTLTEHGKLLALKEVNNGYTHSENLTVFIREVFSETNHTYSDIDAVAVSKGPGSYTGLRIGVSAAKGLCFALNKPLIAINTLQHLSLALNIQHSTPNTLFCPMLDARRMEVYCAIYDSAGNEIKKTSAEIIDEGSFADILKNNRIIFFGDGAAKCKTALSQHSNADFVDNVFPSAQHMMSLSEKAFKEKRFEDVAYFEPYYLKDFVAGKKN